MRNQFLILTFLVASFSGMCQEKGSNHLETAYDVDIELVFVQGGTFMMGSPEDDPYHQLFDQNFDNCRERQSEKSVKDFYIGKYELTYEQYMKITDEFEDQHIPYRLLDSVPTQPVGYMSWWDAVRFCNRLSDLAGYKPYYIDDGNGGVLLNVSSEGYRLPTEAEWEYAAKGGIYNDPTEVYDIAAMSWYKETGGYASVVGKKKPNALGLYDMTGNVWEWVENKFGYSRRYNTIKGGCYKSDPAYCRPAARTGFLPTLRDLPFGFRVVKNIPVPLGG